MDTPLSPDDAESQTMWTTMKTDDFHSSVVGGKEDRREVAREWEREGGREREGHKHVAILNSDIRKSHNSIHIRTS